MLGAARVRPPKFPLLRSICATFRLEVELPSSRNSAGVALGVGEGVGAGVGAGTGLGLGDGEDEGSGAVDNTAFGDPPQARIWITEKLSSSVQRNFVIGVVIICDRSPGAIEPISGIQKFTRRTMVQQGLNATIDSGKGARSDQGGAAR